MTLLFSKVRSSETCCVNMQLNLPSLDHSGWSDAEDTLRLRGGVPSQGAQSADETGSSGSWPHRDRQYEAWHEARVGAAGPAYESDFESASDFHAAYEGTPADSPHSASSRGEQSVAAASSQAGRPSLFARDSPAASFTSSATWKRQGAPGYVAGLVGSWERRSSQTDAYGQGPDLPLPGKVLILLRNAVAHAWYLSASVQPLSFSVCIIAGGLLSHACIVDKEHGACGGDI